MWKWVAAVIPLAFAFVTGASRAATADEFGARRSPADPVLEVNKDPEVCAKALGAMVQAHRGGEFTLNGAAIFATEFSRLEMQAMELPEGRRTGTMVQRADVDLDGVGSLNTLVIHTRPFNWSGDWHYGYVFPSPASFEAVKAQFLARDDDQDQNPSPGQPVMGGKLFYPDAMGVDGKPLSLGNVWAAPRLFAFGKRYYLAYTPNDFEAQSQLRYPIFRLSANGSAEPVCTISVSNREGLHYRFQTLPDLEAWLGVLRTIGDPGPDFGSMHAALRFRAASELGEKIAAARPWAIASRAESGGEARDYHRHGPRLDHFLEMWSLKEPWTRREYQAMQALLPPALRAYSGFLRKEFGLPDARADAAAEEALSGLLAQYILIPAQIEEYETFPDWIDQGALAIVTRNRDAFELQVNQVKREAAAAEYSRLLPLAVEWPYAFDRLLALGADPDLGNPFGKTPLMVAAHFNRPDAVRKLLKAGAKVNAQTTAINDFRYDIKHARRTALMYAGENAGPVVIKLLRDAGADARMADSRDATFAAYLEWNPRFTPAERERLKNQPDAPVTSEASFDCGKASAAVDRAICASEVLRIFDGEIAVAYARLKERRGESLVVEQRDWLRERNRACGARPDADCLAEVMRTRVRVLHERLAERVR